MIRLYITNYEIEEQVSNTVSKYKTIRREYKYYLEDGSHWAGNFKSINKNEVVITMCLDDNTIIEFPRAMTFFQKKTIICGE